MATHEQMFHAGLQTRIDNVPPHWRQVLEAPLLTRRDGRFQPTKVHVEVFERPDVFLPVV